MNFDRENTKVLPLTIAVLEKLSTVSMDNMAELLSSENYLREGDVLSDFRFVTVKSGKDKSFAVYDVTVCERRDQIQLPFDIETGELESPEGAAGNPEVPNP